MIVAMVVQYFYVWYEIMELKESLSLFQAHLYIIIHASHASHCCPYSLGKLKALCCMG